MVVLSLKNINRILSIKTYTMNKQEIIEKLKPIVKPFVKDEEAFNSINEKTHFITDLNINSANLVDIVLEDRKSVV